MNYNPLISIVIPVYNGAKYIEKTLQTISNQSYTNFEVLLVDDSSTDDSFNIISKYAALDSRCKVFKKENGGIVPKTLNFINPFVSGDYFFYSSQDDLFSLDLLEKMINRCLETSASCVLPDMEYYFENEKTNKKTIGLNGNRAIELTGKEAFILSLNWNIHGFALFKSEFLKNEIIPEDAFDADDYVTRKWFLESDKVVFSEGTFFYRQDNSNAITKTFGKKNFYALNSRQKVWQLIYDSKSFEPYKYSAYRDFIYNYYHTIKKYKKYKFENLQDENEISTFLSNFKKQHFTIEFIKNSIIEALKSGKIKFLAVLFVIYFKKL
jgi:glycosyltransferase involved in cell wall biosynthesis